MTGTPASLCASCSFMREVAGRRGQRYLLCRSPAIDVKYPPQPVVSCVAYARGGKTELRLSSECDE